MKKMAQIIDAESELSYGEALDLFAEVFVGVLAGAAKARRKNRVSSIPASRSLASQVMEVLGQRGNTSPRELRAILKCAPMTLTRTLRHLMNSGKITSKGKTRSLRYECDDRVMPHRP